MGKSLGETRDASLAKDRANFEASTPKELVETANERLDLMFISPGLSNITLLDNVTISKEKRSCSGFICTRQARL